MRRLLIPFVSALVLAAWAPLGFAANVQGNSFNLATDGAETSTYLCSAGERLRITITAASGGALSAGDSLFLQYVDRDGNDATIATWTSTDMPVDEVHYCGGRLRPYHIELDDDDASSSVNVEIWVSK